MSDSPSPSPLQSLAVPLAIIFGFGLIAIAIYMSGASAPTPTDTANTNTGEPTQTGDLTKINPVTEDDHIRGNPNAPIIFVEYSDYDCPFCKNFHETMNRIMDEYGTTGDVAWVYRHFPLEQLHPSAPKIAEASECVADLGGNTAFWTFSDLVFEERDTNEPTDMSRLSEFAVTAGVAEAAFTACLESGQKEAAVNEDAADAIEIGGRGTPHTIILVGGEQGVINGAQPYATVKQIVDDLIEQMEGGATDVSE
jgi:protein-disulfide isomerase